jgi:hypothetical protein
LRKEVPSQCELDKTSTETRRKVNLGSHDVQGKEYLRNLWGLANSCTGFSAGLFLTIPIFLIHS